MYLRIDAEDSISFTNFESLPFLAHEVKEGDGLGRRHQRQKYTHTLHVGCCCTYKQMTILQCNYNAVTALLKERADRRDSLNLNCSLNIF